MCVTNPSTSKMKEIWHWRVIYSLVLLSRQTHISMQIDIRSRSSLHVKPSRLKQNKMIAMWITKTHKGRLEKAEYLQKSITTLIIRATTPVGVHSRLVFLHWRENGANCGPIECSREGETVFLASMKNLPSLVHYDIELFWCLMQAFPRLRHTL